MSLFNMGSLLVKLDLDNAVFIAGMSAATSAVHTFQKSTGRTNMVLSNLALAFSAVGIGSVVSDIVMAGEEMINLERRLNVLSNSLVENTGVQADAAETMNWLKETALGTGQAFDSLSKSYIQLVPMAATTGIAIDEVREAIIGVIGAGAILGSTSDEMHRAFVAIRQIVGKDSLQMEELRQQLGEALPNSMLIFADGLDKLAAKSPEIRRELGLIGKDARVTTSLLADMIQGNKIDGELAIRALREGTKEFAQFAELAATNVSGQMQNLRTTLKIGVGQAMADSDLNFLLAAAIETANDRLWEFFDDLAGGTDDAAQTAGEALIDWLGDSIDYVSQLWAEIFVATDTMLQGIRDVFGFIIESAAFVMNIVPGATLELGFLGYIIFGRGGIAGIVKSIAKIGLAIVSVSKISQALAEGNPIDERGPEAGYAMRFLQSESDADSVIGWPDISDPLGSRAFENKYGRLELLQSQRDGEISAEEAARTWSADEAAEVRKIVDQNREAILAAGLDPANINPSAVQGEQWNDDAVVGLYDDNGNLLLKLEDGDFAGLRSARGGLAASRTWAEDPDTQFGLFGHVEDFQKWANGETDEKKDTGAIAEMQKETALYLQGLHAQVEANFGKNTELNDRVADINARITGQMPENSPWHELSPDQKRIYARMLNVGQNMVDIGSTESLSNGVLKVAGELAALDTKVFGGDQAGRPGLLEMVDEDGLIAGMYDKDAITGLYMEIGKKMLNLPKYESDGQAELDIGARIGVLEEIKGKLTEAGLDASKIDPYFEELEKRGDEAYGEVGRSAVRSARSARNEQVRGMREAAAQAQATAEMADRAREAYIKGLTDPALYEAAALKEQIEIANNRMSADAAVYTKSEEELRGLAIQASINDLYEQRAKTMLEIITLKDEEYQVELDTNMLAQQALALEQARQQTRQAGDLDLQMRILEVTREQARAEMEKMKTIMGSAEAMELQLDTAVDQLEVQNMQQQLQYEMMLAPEYEAARQEGELIKQRMALTQMYYEYSLDSEANLAEVRNRGIQMWTEGISTGILDVLEGTKSMGEMFSEVFGNLSRMLAEAAMQAVIFRSTMAVFGNPGMPGGGGGGGGIFDMIGGLFGFGGGGGGGNIMGSLGLFHEGGMVGGWRRYHDGGSILGRNEVPLVAEKGEGIFTPEQMNNADAILNAAIGAAQSRTVVQQNLDVSVNATGGSQEQNQDLANQIGKRLEGDLRTFVREEIGKQQRPGGMLNQI